MEFVDVVVQWFVSRWRGTVMGDGDPKIRKAAALLFDTAAKEGERGNAITAIKRLSGKDREQLVEALVSGLKGNENRSARDGDDGWRLFGEKVAEIAVLKSKHQEQLLVLIEMHAAEVKRVKAARDYVMDVRDRVVAERDRLVDELGRVKAERDCIKSELQWVNAERRRERQRPANLPEIKCAAPGCLNTFRPHRRGHKTCSDTCRKALSRMQAAIQ